MHFACAVRILARLLPFLARKRALHVLGHCSALMRLSAASYLAPFRLRTRHFQIRGRHSWICSIAAGPDCFIVGRESGTVNKYSLPYIQLDNKLQLRCRP